MNEIVNTMKATISIYIILLHILLASGSDTQLRKVDILSMAVDRHVFIIKDGEALIKGELIKRIEFGKNTAVITYLNKTGHKLRPGYHFRIIGPYGIEVASFSDRWIFDTIAAGEIKQEEVSFYSEKVKNILEFSAISLPKDWDLPLYLIIEESDP